MRKCACVRFWGTWRPRTRGGFGQAPRELLACQAPGPDGSGQAPAAVWEGRGVEGVACRTGSPPDGRVSRLGWRRRRRRRRRLRRQGVPGTLRRPLPLSPKPPSPKGGGGRGGVGPGRNREPGRRAKPCWAGPCWRRSHGHALTSGNKRPCNASKTGLERHDCHRSSSTWLEAVARGL